MGGRNQETFAKGLANETNLGEKTSLKCRKGERELDPSTKKPLEIAEEERNLHKRPYFRGKIHMLAFFLTFFLFVVFVFLAKNVNKIVLFLYFASQLILYGISSIYHMKEWTSITKRALFRKLDHSSIFLLIAGTQTCVLSATRNALGVSTTTSQIVLFSLFTYFIAIVGILKVFLFSAVPRYFNILYYVFHGFCAAPFLSLRTFLTDKYISTACVLGAFFYILGSAIYGTKRPNPWPVILGYHEIFHILTVVANFCFMTTLLRESEVKTGAQFPAEIIQGRA